MSCCGQTACNACMIELHISSPVNEDCRFCRTDEQQCQFCKTKCPFCRTPFSSNDMEETDKLLARIEKGDTEAMVHMSIRYMFGDKAEEKDEKKSLELLHRAVDLGGADACVTVGLVYKGSHFQRDYKKAEQLFTQSANAGSATGAYQLGEFYATIKKNTSENVYYFRLSAALGYDRAMKVLTTMYTTSGNIRKILTKEEFEATLRSFQAAQNEMKSEAREKWGDESFESISRAGHSVQTLKLYKQGVISSLPEVTTGSDDEH